MYISSQFFQYHGERVTSSLFHPVASASALEMALTAAAECPPPVLKRAQLKGHKERPTQPRGECYKLGLVGCDMM